MPTFTGTSGADIFTAPDNDNWTILGLGGSDTLGGQGGNDTINGGPGNDTLNGGDGDDIFQFGPKPSTGFDTVIGGAGNDVIQAIADGVVVGLEAIDGIEEISANGFTGVTIRGSANANVFNFSTILLSGIGLISGGAGDDTIIGNLSVANSIDGGTGNDSLTGGNLDDTFVVGKNAGFDTFDGGLGFDSIVAGEEGIKIGLASLLNVERISGGTFFSTQILGTANDDLLDFSLITLQNIFSIDAGDGNDTLIGSVASDTLRGGDGNDTITGGAGDDQIYGDKGDDVLIGGDGNDSFYASDGADVYRGGAGSDSLYATRNNAVIRLDKGVLNSIEEIGANGFTNVTIGAANAEGSEIDLRRLFVNDDDFARIDGSNGADRIFGSKSYDFIFAGLGDDFVNGYLNDDEIHGGAGNDTLQGGNGFDILYGDAGDDILDGGANEDVLFGGAGNDTFLVAKGGMADEYNGDTGIDVIRAAAGVGNFQIAKFTGIEEISWDGTKQLRIDGTFANNSFDFSTVKLTGVSGISMGDGNDTVIGSVIADTINGDAGVDSLSGGEGNDILTGGAGLDTLTGGNGRDLFCDKAADLNGDTITDFSFGDAILIQNAKDASKVVLSYTDDGTGTGGTLRVTGIQALKNGIDIHLDGSFTAADFQVFSDGGSGALIQFFGDTPLI